jgi:hypothetical protein
MNSVGSVHEIDEITATLYFDTHRTYVALVEQSASAVTLSYINATRQPVDVLHTEEEARMSEGMRELQTLLGQIAGKATALSISLDMDSVLFYQMPFAAAASTAEMRDVARFELQMHAPDADPALFHTHLHPLQTIPTSPAQYALGVFIHPTAMDVAHYAARLANLPLKRLGAAQIDAHNAYTFNYPEPEYASELIALCGVQDTCVDVSVVRGGKLLAAATVSLQNLQQTEQTESVGIACRQAIERLNRQIGEDVREALLFGTDLTKSALDAASLLLSCRVERFNPLRRLSTTLPQREREYCSRIAHVLVPSVGSALPDASPCIRL